MTTRLLLLVLAALLPAASQAGCTLGASPTCASQGYATTAAAYFNVVGQHYSSGCPSIVGSANPCFCTVRLSRSGGFQLPFLRSYLHLSRTSLLFCGRGTLEGAGKGRVESARASLYPRWPSAELVVPAHPCLSLPISCDAVPFASLASSGVKTRGSAWPGCGEEAALPLRIPQPALREAHLSAQSLRSLALPDHWLLRLWQQRLLQRRLGQRSEHDVSYGGHRCLDLHHDELLFICQPEPHKRCTGHRHVLHDGRMHSNGGRHLLSPGCLWRDAHRRRPQRLIQRMGRHRVLRQPLWHERQAGCDGGACRKRILLCVPQILSCIHAAPFLLCSSF
jgi:hypothetical protein